MSNKALVVFRKEAKDNIRDKRSLLSSFLLPILYPAILAGMLVMTSKKLGLSDTKPIQLVVAGAQYAPKLIAHLKRHHVKVTLKEKGLEKIVKKGTFKIGLRIPKDFPKYFRAAKPAKLFLIVDNSRRWGKRKKRRLQRLLMGFARYVGGLRLLARGVHPEVFHPFVMAEVDVGTARGYSAMLLSALPMFLMIIVFMGGLYIAIDTTAGEFERGSLEPLLINPLTRFELLLGKYLATTMFAGIGLALSVIGFSLVPFLVSTKQLGFEVHLSFVVMCKVFLLCLPLAAMASSLQMLLATFSKSFKEAQSKLSLFIIIPVIPGMMLMFTPVKPAIWSMLIPTLGEQILINSLIRGDLIQPGYFFLSACSTTIFAGLFFWIASRLYQGERLFLRR